MPCESSQCGKGTGTLYVQAFLVIDSGGSGGKGTAAPLRHVWNAHANKAAHQTSPDGTVRSEYADNVAETRRGDSGKVHRGDLQFNRGR